MNETIIKHKYLLIICFFLVAIFSTPTYISADVEDEVKKEVKQEEIEREIDDSDANLEQPKDVDDYEPEVTEFDDDGKLQDPFEVEISLGTQSAWSKNIPVIITVTPLIDSTRTEIRLDSGYGVEFEKDFEDFFPMTKGEEQSFKATLIPKSEGVYTITASVTDWGYGRNYVSSDSETIKLTENLVTDPKTAGYTTSLIIKYVIIFILLVVFIIVAFIVGRILYRWLKVWLKPLDY